MSILPVTCILCGSDFGDVKKGYGDVAAPVCAECWYEIADERMEDWYGLAPHSHDMTRTGTFLGSTQMVKLPAPNEFGWIDCSSMGWVGTWFRPDDENPAMGVYTHDPLTATVIGGPAGRSGTVGWMGTDVTGEVRD